MSFSVSTYRYPCHVWCLCLSFYFIAPIAPTLLIEGVFDVNTNMTLTHVITFNYVVFLNHYRCRRVNVKSICFVVEYNHVCQCHVGAFNNKDHRYIEFSSNQFSKSLSYKFQRHFKHNNNKK